MPHIYSPTSTMHTEAIGCLRSDDYLVEGDVDITQQRRLEDSMDVTQQSWLERVGDLGNSNEGIYKAGLVTLKGRLTHLQEHTTHVSYFTYSRRQSHL